MDTSSMVKDIPDLFSDENDSGLKLAEFLERRNGRLPQTQSIFANFEPERFSLSVHLQRRSNTPTNNAAEKFNEKHTDGCEKANESLPKYVSQKSVVNETYTNPRRIRPPSNSRLSVHKSGGDRLRRATLTRIATNAQRRSLLPDFESTSESSKFSPPICSTPMIDPIIVKQTTLPPASVANESNNSPISSPKNPNSAANESIPKRTQISQLPVIVIPIHQTFNVADQRSVCANGKNTGLEDASCTLDANIQTSPLKENTINLVTASKSEKSIDVVVANSDKRLTRRETKLLESVGVAHLTDDEDFSSSTRKEQPLDLAAINSRRQLNAMKQSKQRESLNQAIIEPLPEKSDKWLGLELNPRPLNLRISKTQSDFGRRNIHLNKAPNSPINGEKFAREINAHLARLTNMQILDLRKRNSLGKIYPKCGRKSVALEKQLQLENEIKIELVKRELNKESTRNTTDRTQSEDIDAMLENILAPPEFRDDNGSQQLDSQEVPANTDHNSLDEDESCDRVLLIPPNKRATRNAIKRGNKESLMSSVLKNYLNATHTVRRRNHRRSSRTKRSLYSNGQSYTEDNILTPSPQKASKATLPLPVEIVNNELAMEIGSTTRSTVLQTSTKKLRESVSETTRPLSELLSNTCTSREENIATVSKGHASPARHESAVFKKPYPPKQKSRCRPSKEVISPAIDETTRTGETEQTLRRSKRGHIPLKNNWSSRTTDPTPLFQIIYMDQFLKRFDASEKRKKAKPVRSYADILTSLTALENSTCSYHAERKKTKPKEKSKATSKQDHSPRATTNERYLSPILDTMEELEHPTVVTAKHSKVEENTKKTMTQTKQKKLDYNKKRKTRKQEAEMCNKQFAPEAHENIESREDPTAMSELQGKNTSQINSDASAKISNNSKKTQAKKRKDPRNVSVNPILEHSRQAFTTAPVEYVNRLFDSHKVTDNATEDTSQPQNKLKKLRVRLQRTSTSHTTTTDSSTQSELASASSTAVTVVKASSSGGRQSNSELLRWLKGICNLKTGLDNGKIFREMHCSAAGNLTFSDLDGVDYAFYDSGDSSLGYLRFKPLQAKPSRRSKSFDLYYVVMSGDFTICTNKEKGRFAVGDMVAIHKGMRYSIKNESNEIAVMSVFKK